MDAKRLKLSAAGAGNDDGVIAKASEEVPG